MPWFEILLGSLGSFFLFHMVSVRWGRVYSFGYRPSYEVPVIGWAMKSVSRFHFRAQDTVCMGYRWVAYFSLVSVEVSTVALLVESWKVEMSRLSFWQLLAVTAISAIHWKIAKPQPWKPVLRDGWLKAFDRRYLWQHVCDYWVLSTFFWLVILAFTALSTFAHVLPFYVAAMQTMPGVAWAAVIQWLGILIFFLCCLYWSQGH